MSTAIAPTRPSPRHNMSGAPRRPPPFPFDPLLMVLEPAGAVDTPFPGVTVEKDVVSETLLNGGITALVVEDGIPVVAFDTVTLSVVELEEGEEEGELEDPMIGIEVVDERGGDGVTEGIVTVIVRLEPPGKVVVKVTTSVTVVEPEVTANVDVDDWKGGVLITF